MREADGEAIRAALTGSHEHALWPLAHLLSPQQWSAVATLVKLSAPAVTPLRLTQRQIDELVASHPSGDDSNLKLKANNGMSAAFSAATVPSTAHSTPSQAASTNEVDNDDTSILTPRPSSVTRRQQRLANADRGRAYVHDETAESAPGAAAAGGVSSVGYQPSDPTSVSEALLGLASLTSNPHAVITLGDVDATADEPFAVAHARIQQVWLT
jgi:hypothetical protein